MITPEADGRLTFGFPHAISDARFDTGSRKVISNGFADAHMPLFA